VSVLDTFLLTLFEKYAELLKRRFSDDFQEVISIIADGLLPATNTRVDCIYRRLYAHAYQ
jgi:exocyst complex component 6